LGLSPKMLINFVSGSGGNVNIGANMAGFNSVMNGLQSSVGLNASVNSNRTIKVQSSER
jgi:hypothetical protein